MLIENKRSDQKLKPQGLPVVFELIANPRTRKKGVSLGRLET
jgi:hypothetical protein